jgi:hypothetical protein
VVACCAITSKGWSWWAFGKVVVASYNFTLLPLHFMEVTKQKEHYVGFMTCQMSVVRNSFIWLLHLLLYRYIDIGQYPEDFMFQSNYWQALIINLPIYASSIDTMVLFHAINHPFIDHLVWSNHIISAFRFVLYHHIDTKDDKTVVDIPVSMPITTHSLSIFHCFVMIKTW